MNWNISEEFANPEPKPKALGEAFREAITGLGVGKLYQPPADHQKSRVWSPGDLWAGIPEEFHSAELSQGLLAMLKKVPRPASFALVGPPGTGKTRSLWAMVHSMRKRFMADFIGTEILRQGVADGQYASRRESCDETIARTLAMGDQLTIITEVGDIRAKRYDRAALDEWSGNPGWLAIDDIGAIEPNEWVREALYHLANERRANNLTTVWTSNLTPQKIRDTFGGAIASRILGGAVIETSGADRRCQ